MKESELQELFSFRNEYRSLRYDLWNIETLCEELGNPERSFRSVLVAGTNGKGSVARYLAGMLPDAGLYVSPHLESLNERISIGLVEIPDFELGAVADQVRQAADRLESRLPYPLTYFERVTAMAFCYFRGRVSHAVLEVGLGGRLDATNVVSQDVSVITNIGLDHEEHLGATVEAIAFEKAGIIGAREAVVVGPRCEYPIIRERAGERLVRALPSEATVRDCGGGFFEFDLPGPRGDFCGIRPSLPGRHQIENAVVAIRAAECLREAGWPIDNASIAHGLSSARWPGRLELVPGDPPILLDGAHNPDAAHTLAAYLREVYPEGVSMVFGVVAGKDWARMLEILAPHATTLILTRPASDRAVDPHEISRLIGGAPVAPDVGEAIRLARARCRPGSPVLVTGSLYLVGEARGLVTARRVREVFRS